MSSKMNIIELIKKSIKYVELLDSRDEADFIKASKSIVEPITKEKLEELKDFKNDIDSFYKLIDGIVFNRQDSALQDFVGKNLEDIKGGLDNDEFAFNKSVKRTVLTILENEKELFNLELKKSREKENVLLEDLNNIQGMNL